MVSWSTPRVWLARPDVPHADAVVVAARSRAALAGKIRHTPVVGSASVDVVLLTISLISTYLQARQGDCI